MALKSQANMLSDRSSETESLPLLEAKSPSRPIGELILSGSAYIGTSSALILFNKHALASFHWQCPNVLLAFHCILAVILVKAVEAAGKFLHPCKYQSSSHFVPPSPPTEKPDRNPGLIKLEPLRWSLVRIWFPGGLRPCHACTLTHACTLAHACSFHATQPHAMLKILSIPQ